MAELRIEDGTLLNGTGTIRMGNNDGNRILGSLGTNILTNGPDHKIAGSGAIGVNTMGLINNGTIQADQPVPLVIDPSGANVVNNGLFIASNGGTLRLFGGTFNNANGTILAQQDSIVRLSDNANVSGGILESEGTGRFALLNDDQPIVSGEIENNALITFDASGNGMAELRIEDGTLLNGTGTIRMGNDDGNRIRSSIGTNILTNGPNHKIAGSGAIGVNTMGLINNGTIQADQPVPLVIDPSGANVVNNGLFIASNGGTLRLFGGTFNNANGTILAQQDSIVRLSDNANVSGGILESEGTGRFALLNDDQPIVSGEIENNALITFDASGNGIAELRVEDGTLLNGTGTIRMGNDDGNRIRSSIGTNILTNGPNHKIAGSGAIGINTMGLINNGTIQADQPVPLVIDPSGANVVNNGLFIASQWRNTTIVRRHL